MRYSILLVLVFISACGKEEPITLSESQAQYVGVWQFRYESETDSSLEIDNMLLVISADSTAAYRQCKISRTFSDNSSSSRSSSVSMPDAYVIALGNGEITVEQGADISFMGNLAFDYNLEITKEPYDENGRSYMGIEDTLLQKLQGDEISTQTDWECPDDDDEEDF